MPSGPENGTEFVRAVLDSLSQEEKLALKYLMRTTKGWRNHKYTLDTKDDLELINPEKLRRAVFHVSEMSGIRYNTQSDALALQLLPTMKTSLQRTRVPKTWVSIDYGVLLPPFEFQHPTMGTIVFSTHSQQRFMERHSSGHWGQGDLQKKAREIREPLGNAISRAQITKLEPPHEVVRTINNGFKPAVYLFDSVTGLRFVLSKDTDDTPRTVLTIEQPKK